MFGMFSPAARGWSMSSDGGASNGGQEQEMHGFTVTGDDGTGAVKQTRGWHGTGGFPAENIYMDRQDGCELSSPKHFMLVGNCHTNCGNAVQS